jgi:serine/threonine protein kinase
MLPLHLAARNKTASSEVIAALLTAHPGGAEEKDDNGNLPLHMAAANNASSEVIAALLTAHPGGATEKDDNGILPLHMAAANNASSEVIAVLLAAHPAGAAEKDGDGILPLHRAVGFNVDEHETASGEVIAALLMAHPAGAAEKNRDGDLPLAEYPIEMKQAIVRSTSCSYIALLVVDFGPELHDEVNKAIAARYRHQELNSLVPYFMEPRSHLDGDCLWNGFYVLDEVHVPVIQRLLSLAPSLYDALDPQGRTAYSRATAEVWRVMDQAVQFCWRYKVTGTIPEHQSETCLVYRAHDMLGGGDGGDGGGGTGDSGGGGRRDPVPVVLKLMRRRDQFKRERAAMNQLGMTTGSGANATGPGQQQQQQEHVVRVLATSDDAALRERWAADAEARSWSGCAQGLVMESGDRNLMAALLQERMTLEYGLKTLEQIARALEHLHGLGLVHCDVKPLNVVRAGTEQTWRLINFDAAVRVGHFAGSKSSTGYCPPELLVHRAGTAERRKEEEMTGRDEAAAAGKVCVRAWAPSTSEEEDHGEEYELLRAAPSFDVSSFGVVAFHVLTGRMLFHANSADNLDADELAALHAWDERELRRRLRAALPDSPHPPGARRETLQDLVEWCLQADPAQRPRSMAEVTSHVAFHPDGEGYRRGEAGVFISHKQTTGARAVQLLKERVLANARGALSGEAGDGEDRVFVDVDSNLGKWSANQKGLAVGFLGDAMRRRRTFLLFLSEDTLEAGWVVWEVRLAIALRKRLVVVVKEGDDVGKHIAAAQRQDAAGPPDWMHPHYLSDEHRDAKLGSVFEHFVVPFMMHPAFVQVSTRIITESITGGDGGGGGGSGGGGGDGDDDDHSPALDAAGAAAARGKVALLGNPAQRETLYMLAGQLSRALDSNSGAGGGRGMDVVVNPPPSSSIRVDAAVAFLTAGWSPRPTRRRVSDRTAWCSCARRTRGRRSAPPRRWKRRSRESRPARSGARRRRRHPTLATSGARSSRNTPLTTFAPSRAGSSPRRWRRWREWRRGRRTAAGVSWNWGRGW